MNKNITKTVKKVFEAMPQGTKYKGWEIRNKCVELDPTLEHVYVDTFLRIIRKYFSDQYELISHDKSLYVKTGKQVIELEEKKETIKNPIYKKYEGLKQQSFDFGEC